MMYSYPYVFLLIFMGACAFLYEYTQEEDKRKQIITFSVFFFLVFFGFRGYVYTDWIVYTDMFRNAEWGDLMKFDITDEKIHEPGFLILCMLCKNIFNHYIFLTLVCTIIYVLLIIRFCKQFEVHNIPLVLMLLIAMDGSVIILNLLRNSISMAIWLNALIYIRDRKPLPYFVLCFLALTFHLSSILFFPLYYLLSRKINRWIFLWLFFFFFLFYLSKASIVLSIIQLIGFEGALGLKAEAYTEIYTTARILNPSGTLEKLTLISLLFIYYDEIIEKNKGHYIIINSLLAYFFMYYFFGEFKTMSERMSLLFVFARWIIWIDLIKILIIENNKKLLAAIIFIYCLYMTSLNLNEPVIEYDNVLLGAKTEAQRRQVYYKVVQDEE